MKVADYERVVLAALLRNPEVRNPVASELTEDKFGYGPGFEQADSHKLIYGAVLDLVLNKKPIDLSSIERQLGDNLELAGGSVYLKNLLKVPDKLGLSTQNREAIFSWVKFVDNAGRLRHSGMVIDKYARMYDDFEKLAVSTESVDQFLSKMISEIQEAQGLLQHSYAPISEGVSDFRRRLELSAKGHITEVLPTGWPSFFNQGLPPRQGLVVISGLESSGKTQLALQMLLGRAIQMRANGEKGCVAINSYEMPFHRLVKRMACCLAGIDGQELMLGKYDSDSKEVHRINKVLDFIVGLDNIYCDDSQLMGSEAIHWHSNALHVNHGPLTDIVIDYAELVPDKAETEELRVSRVYKNAGRLRAIGTTAYVISQVNRMWGNKSKVASIDQLRYSGAAGHVADVVLHLYNMPAMKARTIEFTCPSGLDEDKAYIYVQKFKEGEPKIIPLNWEGSCTRFSDIALSTKFGKPPLYENLPEVREMLKGDF